jgi:endonuclease YncB( thermonuclease family)
MVNCQKNFAIPVELFQRATCIRLLTCDVGCQLGWLLNVPAETYHPTMTPTQRLTILIVILFAGCDLPPTTAPQTAPDRTVQAETTNLPSEQTTPPESPPEPIEQADQITGKVIHIADGDTIDVLTADKTTIRIRLNGIDAPETGQPFGRNAKQYLSEFIGGQTVRVVTHDKDRYGRTIGDVYFEDAAGPDFKPGTVLPPWNINRELVKRGLAWHYKQYSDDENLAMDEIRAKELKRGLWSDARHVAPWEWRKLSKDERDKLR